MRILHRLAPDDIRHLPTAELRRIITATERQRGRTDEELARLDSYTRQQLLNLARWRRQIEEEAAA